MVCQEKRRQVKTLRQYILKFFQAKIPLQEKCINPPINERVDLDFAKKKDFHRRMPKGLKYERQKEC